ncbi:hypothetical protein ABPG75_012722 [Micractinium tetrahymenae]
MAPLRVVLALLLAARLVAANLLLAYSIERHGARNVLPKTATLKESDAAGGPTLLPEGQLQAWKAGAAYAARYLNASTCATDDTCLDLKAAANSPGPEYGVVGTADGTWNNFNTLFRSSALDRTIMTARSFLDAVFPPMNVPTTSQYLPDGQQVVPVYSLPEDGNTLTRAYTACPTYDTRLLNWYQSDEFKAKEADSAPLRDSIAANVSGLNTSLTNWWNVYDGFNVYRIYGVGTPMPDVDNQTFAQMQELAYWLETSKMHSSLTGNLLAGPLLADLLSYLEAAATAATSNVVDPVYYKVVHLSGHYDTQLGILGAIALNQLPAAANFTWFKKIPSLAAIMVFELHASGSDGVPQSLAVRLVMQDGPSANYTTIPLPCASAGDGAEALAGPGACTLEAFTQMVQPLAMNTSQWCDACANTGMTMCQLKTTAKALEVANATLAANGLAADGQSASAGAASSGSGDSGLSDGAWAGILVGCIAAVSALFGVAFVAYRRRMTKELEQARLGGMQAVAALPGTV